MKAKALAENFKTGKIEWFVDVFTDGSTVFKETKCGFKPIKNVIQLWVTLGDERSYVCVFDTE